MGSAGISIAAEMKRIAVLFLHACSLFTTTGFEAAELQSSESRDQIESNTVSDGIFCAVQQHSAGALQSYTLESEPLNPRVALEPPAHLDLLVLYTSQAQVSAGGTSGMHNLVRLALEEARLCYDNSRVPVQLHLVGIKEVPYEESGHLPTDLLRLSKSQDGYLDEVHALRNLHGADLVCLIVEEESSGQFAGIANTILQADGTSSSRCFSVIRRAFLVGNYTLPHELGHNLGCGHNHESPRLGLFEDSWAHRFESNGKTYRTVLGNRPGLQIPYFSNPNVTFRGISMGVPLGQPNPANNARTMEVVAPVVARYRNPAGRVHLESLPSPIWFEKGGAEIQLLRRGDTASSASVVLHSQFRWSGSTEPTGLIQKRPVSFEPGSAEQFVTIAWNHDSIPARNGHIELWLKEPSENLVLGYPSEMQIRVQPIPENEEFVLDEDFSVPAVNHVVRTILLQGQKALMAGGGFTQASGEPRNRLARLFLDGTLDPEFHPGHGAKYDVFDLALDSNDAMYIAGEFNTFDHAPVPFLARMDANGSLDRTFVQTNGPNGFVTSLALQPDSKLVIGGHFRRVGGVSRNHLARLNVDGTLDQTFDTEVGANDAVHDVLFLENGRMMIAGDFTTFNGERRLHFALVGSKAELLNFSSINPSADGPVHVIAPDGKGGVFIGGEFKHVNGVLKTGLARLNENGTLHEGFDTGHGINGQVAAIAWLDNERILIGGAFSSVNNQPRSNTAILNTDGTLDPMFGTTGGLNGPVMALAVESADTFYVGGAFRWFHEEPAEFLVRFRRIPPSEYLMRLARPEMIQQDKARIDFNLQPGGTIVFESSNDLRAWTPVQTNYFSAGTTGTEVTTHQGSDGPSLFFRAKYQ